MSEPISTPAAQPPGTWRRLVRNRVAIAAMVILGAIALIAILGPSILRDRYSPEIPTAAKLVPPSGAHYFGTDMNGRDVFSRVIQGARISLIVGCKRNGSCSLADPPPPFGCPLGRIRNG